MRGADNFSVSPSSVLMQAQSNDNDYCTVDFYNKKLINSLIIVTDLLSNRQSWSGGVEQLSLQITSQ